MESKHEASETNRAAPPYKLHHDGIDLELYDSTPMLLRGELWYTYIRLGQSGLWEHCPVTGQTIKTQE